MLDDFVNAIQMVELVLHPRSPDYKAALFYVISIWTVIHTNDVIAESTQFSFFSFLTMIDTNPTQLDFFF